MPISADRRSLSVSTLCTVPFGIYCGALAHTHSLVPCVQLGGPEKLPPCQSFDRLRRRDPLHSERSPEHPLAFFSLDLATSESTLASHHGAGPPPTTRAASSSENAAAAPVFPPHQCRASMVSVCPTRVAWHGPRVALMDVLLMHG
jgi:hypothetical protein